MSILANNDTAIAYGRSQSGYIDASREGRLQILLNLKQLLIQARSYTTIFDHEVYVDGHRVVINAADQLVSVQRHIDTHKGV